MSTTGRATIMIGDKKYSIVHHNYNKNYEALEQVVYHGLEAIVFFRWTLEQSLRMPNHSTVALWRIKNLKPQ